MRLRFVRGCDIFNLTKLHNECYYSFEEGQKFCFMEMRLNDASPIIF